MLSLKHTAAPALVLASASPRRRELLPALGLPFAARATDVDETPPAGAEPAALAAMIARRKADAARTHAGDLPVLAADTVVACDGRPFGKPQDAGEATAMLRALRGREHTVYTGVVLSRGERIVQATAASRVLMRRYSDDEIAASIAAGTPFDKAGAYAIQDPLLRPVERCDGCYCNVMGLPLWTVRRLLLALAPALQLAPPGASLSRCAVCPLQAGDG